MSKARRPSYRIEHDTRWLTRRRDALLKRLAKTGPFVNGSLVLIHRTCGNSENCRCMRGHKHASWYLSYGVKGKTKMVYIPVDLEEEVRGWSEQYGRVKSFLQEICDLQKQIIRRHVQERDRKRRR